MGCGASSAEGAEAAPKSASTDPPEQDPTSSPDATSKPVVASATDTPSNDAASAADTPNNGAATANVDKSDAPSSSNDAAPVVSDAPTKDIPAATPAPSTTPAPDPSTALAGNAAGGVMRIRLKNIIGVEKCVECDGTTFGALQAVITKATGLEAGQQQLVMCDQVLDFQSEADLGSCKIQSGAVIVYSRRKGGETISQVKMLTVNVRNLVGKEEAIELKESDSLQCLRDAIEKAFSVPADAQRLVLEADSQRNLKEMAPDSVLAACGITDGAIIIVGQIKSKMGA